MMSEWKCPTCNTVIDADLACCWNCGTSSDGNFDPNFVREVDVATLPAGWVQRIQCESCGYEGKALKGHHGYKWWTYPVSMLVSCTLIGFIPWVFVFLILGNRTYKACPKCDERDRIIDRDGAESKIETEAEAIWKAKQDADIAAFKKNKLILLTIVLVALFLSIASLVATMNRN